MHGQGGRVLSPVRDTVAYMYGKIPYNVGMTTAAASATSKTSRIDIRMSDEQRALIDKAAAVKGSTVSQWVLSHLVHDAERDILEESTIRLSSKSYDNFLKALDRPMPEQMRELLSRDPEWL